MERETQIQKYVLTQDTFAAVMKLTGGNISGGLKNEIDLYFKSLESLVGSAFAQNQIAVESFSEEEIEENLSEKVRRVFDENQDAVCACLDRFLLNKMEALYPDRFFRLQITRALSGGKTSRQGTPLLEIQFDNLVSFLGNRNLVLVDDGIFSGGSSNYVVNELDKRGVKKDRIIKFIGFIGNGVRVEGAKTEIIRPIDNMYEWVDIRDFSVFGGKKFEASKKNNVATAVPYLYPWSDGGGASFDKLGNFFEISRGMIKSFAQLIGKVERETGKAFLIKDFIKAGFAIPTNTKRGIYITINTTILEYLNKCLNLIEKEQNREVYIFDMDGTLYQLDGKENGFSESSLEKAINRNALKFITEMEKTGPSESMKIFEEGIRDSVGLSAFLARRYGITRTKYFNFVWDIDPRGLINNFEIPVEKVKEIAKTGKKLILLTSAPSVWQEKVIEYLGLTGKFETIYTGTDFSTKEEIFAILSQRYNPNKMISIGDQEKTDITPAQKYGIKGLLVKNPKDISL